MLAFSCASPGKVRGVQITWREDKRRRNLRKHGLDIASAAALFQDPHAVTVFDRIEDAEERWHTIGALFIGNSF